MLLRKSVSPQTQIAVLAEQMEKMGQTIRQLRQAGPSSLQADDWRDGVDPFPWETIINHPGRHRLAWPEDTAVYWHPGITNRITGEVIPAGWYAIGGPTLDRTKHFADDERVTTGVTVNSWQITEDCNAMKIIRVAAYVIVPGSGATTLMIRNTSRSNTNVLTTAITIDSGEQSSYFSGSPAVINIGGDPTNPWNKVYTGNIMEVEVLTVGSGARGLGVDVTMA